MYLVVEQDRNGEKVRKQKIEQIIIVGHRVEKSRKEMRRRDDNRRDEKTGKKLAKK
jgi:hypothetical protein